MNSRLPIALSMALSLGAAAMAVVAPPALGATTFVVNKVGDAADLNLANTKCDTSSASGNQCTLRAAIQEANDTPGADTINFKITSAGTAKVIAPASPLPQITEQVKIDGYSQSGSSVNTLATGDNAVLKIVLDGINAGAGANGLAVGGFKSVIQGLVVQRFDGSGLVLTGEVDQVYGCFVGTNAASTAARGNSVGITVAGTNATIGGSFDRRNVVSGNSADGVLIAGDDAVVAGNYIGTRKGGTVALPNGGNGVRIEGATGSRIGVPTAGLGNLISGNDGNGVHVYKDSGASDAVIQGNLIGTNAAGTADLGNSGSGVYTDALSVQIGGDTALKRNVISGNDEAGITLQGSDENVIQGNLIGTKADGTGDLGNQDGIYLAEAADDNTIGGTGAAGNVISGNDFEGILLMSGIANTVTGNVIRANGFHGILAGDGVVTIGGGNLIFGNGQDGIEVAPSATGVHITANQIYANGALGIDLNGGTENTAKVTANDTDDPDSGANGLQNYPVFNSAFRAASGLTTITGSLNSIPSTAFIIELFLAVADASGNGEGQVLLATQTITTNSGGDKSFTFQLGNLSPGMTLTATASTTLFYGNTSEFSANVVVVPAP